MCSPLCVTWVSMWSTIPYSCAIVKLFPRYLKDYGGHVILTNLAKWMKGRI